MKTLELAPGSDAYDNAMRGYVRAERINDVIAKPETDRYRDYLHLIQSQYMGEPDIDQNDQYRESEDRLHLVARAIEHYECRHGVEVTRGRIYLHDDFPLAAAPDGIDGVIGLTVHTRTRLKTYDEALKRGVTATMMRHTWAMMAVTNLRFWIHLNYFEDAETRTRKLSEHDAPLDRIRAAQLLGELQIFAAKTRFQALAETRQAG